MKKLSIGGYLNILAAVLGVVGAILIIVSSTMSSDNSLAGLTMIAGAGIAGAVLCLLSVYTPTRLGNFDPAGSISIWIGIALYCYAFGASVGQRVMMIAGLFSFNAGNTVGWSVFYVSIAAWVCLLLGCLILIVSGFFKTAKQTT